MLSLTPQGGRLLMKHWFPKASCGQTVLGSGVPRGYRLWGTSTHFRYFLCHKYCVGNFSLRSDKIPQKCKNPNENLLIEEIGWAENLHQRKLDANYFNLQLNLMYLLMRIELRQSTCLLYIKYKVDKHYIYIRYIRNLSYLTCQKWR